MPFVDNPDENSEDQVSGSTPLGQGGAQQTAGASADAGEASSGAQITSGATPDQMQSQGIATNKKAPKASSGMFTNIQKYVQKNKPQAQKMAGAATEDFGKQASEIRQAAESKKSEQSNLIGANTGLMETAKGQAGAAVNQIMGTQAETPHYQAAGADQFQDLMKGQIEGYQNVGDLDLAQQQRKGEALAQLAKGTQTEQGRRNLLGETFRKQGDYSRGMSGLDQLITSGDKGARESIIQGTQGTARDLGSRLGTISSEAAQAKTAQDLAKGKFGEDVTGLASGKTSGIMSDIDQKILDEQTARNTALEGFKGTQADLENRLATLSNIYGGNLGAGSRLSGQLSGQLGPNMDMLNRYGIDTSQFKDFEDLRAQSALTPEEAALFGVDLGNAWQQSSAGGQFDIGDVNTAYGQMGGSLGDFNLQSDLEQQLHEQGSTYKGLTDQSDLTAGRLASQDQVDKYNALQALMGRSDIIAPESQGDYLDQAELAEILKRYNV